MLALSLCNIFLEPGRIREMQLAYFAISQGFDCVHHETLIGKLRHYGVTGRALDLLKSYLSNRVQRVDVNVRNKELEFVNSTVFLGITLDDRLQWGPHIITKALKTEGYTPIPLLKKPDNSVAIDDAEIAECLADSIETQCYHASPPRNIAHISRIEEEVLQNTSLEPKDDLAPVSLSEVQTLVKSLNTRKAPGLDGISNKAIKCFSIPLLSLLVAIFNACIKNCYFPPAWKEAEVIGIYKPGNNATSCQLQTDQPPERHERTHSTRRLIRAGVPQGSTLSPLLYSAYTNDVPRPSSSGVQLALFADDTALFYGSRNRSTRFTLLPLQRAIDELGQWFRKWRIEVNPDKSASIQFKYGKIRSRLIVDKNTPNLKMLDANIPWQRNYKYLGITLDKNLHFQDHIERVRILHFSTKQGSGPCSVEKVKYLDVINVPYTKCIRTVMTYASPVFAPLESTTYITGSHSNALLRRAVDYQPPHPTHLIRRPRNVLTDPPGALTAAVESLNDVNDTHD
ncbi:Probable RNA-directed DNA polymerase from transposon BS [Eumeta japonica]|uniref:Probable RNA-directed DNA polymerase from transposon BS n=1 Tax=Eumeta variegata TaxID=151549 RepID=A0A4C1VQN6_EUMVA|nr:Probable RNA-directed DNA polymerase from transposon BS [Eumeta japonica]